MLLIFYIQPLNYQLIGKGDVDFVEGNGGLKLVFKVVGGFFHHPGLYGWQQDGTYQQQQKHGTGRKEEKYKPYDFANYAQCLRHAAKITNALWLGKGFLSMVVAQV